MDIQISSNIEQYLKGPIAILGYGVSGKAAKSLLDHLNCAADVFDEKAEGCLRDFDARQYAFVISSPGLHPSHPWLESAKKADSQVVSEFDFASAFWKGECVAITGTNGKTTSTLFLTEAFKGLGKKAIAVGNVGYPFSSLIREWGNGEDAIAVCEVSSFQAQAMEYFSPDAVLWTNFSEDHLDHHASMEEYFFAKCNLISRARERSIYVGESVFEYANAYGVPLPQYTELVYSNLGSPMIVEGVFSKPPQAENYALIHSYWEKQGYDMELLRQIATTFSPPKHRMGKVAAIEGVSFWNDSKGTNFSSTEAALSYFDEKVLWIGGGKDKRMSLEGFVKNIYKKIDSAYLIGETGPRLKALLEEAGVKAYFFKTLEMAFEKAREDSVENSNIVFSPGFSSYDMFSSFVERGNLFERLVLGLKKPMKCAS